MSNKTKNKKQKASTSGGAKKEKEKISAPPASIVFLIYIFCNLHSLAKTSTRIYIMVGTLRAGNNSANIPKPHNEK